MGFGKINIENGNEKYTTECLQSDIEKEGWQRGNDYKMIQIKRHRNGEKEMGE